MGNEFDKRSENKDIVIESAEKYGTNKRMVVLANFLIQANKMIEHMHKLVIDAFSKMSDEESTNWVQNSPIVM